MHGGLAAHVMIEGVLKVLGDDLHQLPTSEHPNHLIRCCPLPAEGERVNRTTFNGPD